MIQLGIKTGPWEGFGDFHTLERVWLEAESLGFDCGWLSDHLFDIPGLGPSDEPCLEAWVTLSALAGVTKKLRLGITCTCNNFRNPALLAKMSSTLDVISGGRLELALGAGIGEAEHRAYGLPFEKLSARAERLKEAVIIISKMWRETKPSFRGRYYSIEDAVNNPKPIQRPLPPIWVGGRNERFILKIAAEVGDGCNFISLSPQEYQGKLNALQNHCKELGTDFERIGRSWQGHVLISEDEAGVRDRLGEGVATRGDDVERYRASNIVGTPDECIEKVAKYVGIGVTHFALRFPETPEDMSGMRLFAREVIPSFR